MTDDDDLISVRRDDLALIVDTAMPGRREREAYDRLRAALVPPQPTLRDAFARAVHDAGHAGTTWEDCRVDHYVFADRVLPVVEAAVSAAADEAWNAALDAMLEHWQRHGPVMYGDIQRHRRPTEGSAS